MKRVLADGTVQLSEVRGTIAQIIRIVDALDGQQVTSHKAWLITRLMWWAAQLQVDTSHLMGEVLEYFGEPTRAEGSE